MVNESADRIEVNKLKNQLVQVAGESNVFAFDVNKFIEDLSSNMVILLAASGAIAIILFILTFFQITVSVQSSLREDA